MGLPVVDCDLMGRAFPQLQIITPVMNGFHGFPYCMRNIQGFELILTRLPDGQPMKNAETFLRNVAVGKGADMGLAGMALTKQQLLDWAIRNSMSHIWYLGRDIIEARKRKENPLMVIQEKEGGKLLFTGKVISVDLELKSG